MTRLALACAAILLLISNAMAQDESPNCVWLRGEIARIQKNLNGLQALASGNNVAVMQCKQRPGEPWGEAEERCARRIGSLGTWHDPETQMTYIILTKQYVTDYASNAGFPPEKLARAFNRSEAVADKIRGGPFIESMQGELRKAIINYQSACGTQGPPQTDGGLLGVPGFGQPIPPKKKRWW
jgi:hypothetical protein